MDVLWGRGSAPAEQVRAGLGRRKHPLKDSSVRTLLRRLEAQGYLRHEVDGKTFVYQAAAPSRRFAVRAVRQIVDRFFAGSMEQLLVGVVDEKVLDARDIARLAAKVRKARDER